MIDTSVMLNEISHIQVQMHNGLTYPHSTLWTQHIWKWNVGAKTVTNATFLRIYSIGNDTEKEC